MKILFCGRYIDTPRGGAEFSALALLEKLYKNHNVSIFSIANSNSTGNKWCHKGNLIEWKFSPFLQKRILPGELRELLIEKLAAIELGRIYKEIQPDLVISQGNILFPNVHHSKTIMFVVDYGSSISRNYYPNFAVKALNKMFATIRRKKLKNIDLVINRSMYMASLLKQYAIKSEVIAPFIDLSQYRINKNFRPRFITFLKPVVSKGVDIVMRIAKRIPDKEFLIVGRINSDIRKKFSGCENIHFLNWCNDMKTIYGQTRILLVPSICEEAFGRVPVEAGINCIPTIASNRGGLPEAVGEGGILIDDVWDIDRWVEAIELLHRDDIYQEYSKKAGENAARFNVDKIFEEFRKIVKEKLNLKL